MSTSHEFGKGGVNIIIDVNMMSILWIKLGSVEDSHTSEDPNNTCFESADGLLGLQSISAFKHFQPRLIAVARLLISMYSKRGSQSKPA